MMFSKSIAQIALSLSLLTAAVAGWAQAPIDTLEKNAAAAQDRPSLEKVVDEAEQHYPDEDWIEEIRLTIAERGFEAGKTEFIAALEIERSEENVAVNLKDPKQEAEEILSSPAYRDAGVREDQENSEWLARIIEEFLRQIYEFLMRLLPRGSGGAVPTIGGIPAIGFGAVLAVVLILFVGFMIWRFGVARKVRKKAGGLLEEDEPDRTADEWLQQADLLTRNGDYRKAIRSLYLACLVRFDDANVAVFNRGETNWEHLHRIMASPKKPAGLDFRPPTKSFDLFWYGYAPCSAEDVAEFRKVYESLLSQLAIRRAA